MTDFTCQLYEEYGSACGGVPQYQDTGYCVLHFAGKEKKDDTQFEEAIRLKLEAKDFRFAGAYFPGSSEQFVEVEFDSGADFSFATFEEANFSFSYFEEVTFHGATFEHATFNQTRFKEATFQSASLKETHFHETAFKTAMFIKTTFGEAYFTNTAFGDVNFQDATFEDVHFTSVTFGTTDSNKTLFGEKYFAPTDGLTFGGAYPDKSVSRGPSKASFVRTSFKGAYFLSETTFEKGANFLGAEFGEAHFYKTIFRNGTLFTDASFEDARFQGTKFETVDFTGVTFEGMARFDDARFEEEANFHKATFGGEAHFPKVAFTKAARFDGVKFDGEAHFPNVTFKMTRFDGASFRERVAFYDLDTSPETMLNFRKTTIEKPERVSFHNTDLRPSWFVDVDSQKFDFSNVEWFRLPREEKSKSEDVKLSLEEEITALTKSEIQALKEQPEYKSKTEDEKRENEDKIRKQSPGELAKACRRLMNNAEENREYPLANEFQYWSMDATRKGNWSFFKDLAWGDLLNRDSWLGIARHFGLITTLYWALSGYGVRAARAFWVLVAICVAFAVFYNLLGPTELNNFSTALVYSLGALARLNPNPRPDPGLFQFLVIVEGLLGPLQIALLVLAIRRKVMR